LNPDETTHHLKNGRNETPAGKRLPEPQTAPLAGVRVGAYQQDLRVVVTALAMPTMDGATFIQALR
jgi:CheY-like chemotaxis protein